MDFALLSSANAANGTHMTSMNSGRQQSQQTSFEVRFLHVNFSYSLKFI